MASAEQKQPEDAAKRRLQEVLKEGQASKQLHLSELDKFDEVLEAIKQDPEWQWVPDKLGYSEQRLTWSTPGMQNVTLQVMDDLSIEVDDLDGDTKTFDFVHSALKHVDQRLKGRALPRVRQLIQDLKQVTDFDLRTLFRQQLVRWAVAFPDFKMVKLHTNQAHEASLTVSLCDMHCLIKAEGSPDPRVWFPDHMVRLLSLPESD